MDSSFLIMNHAHIQHRIWGLWDIHPSHLLGFLLHLAVKSTYGLIGNLVSSQARLKNDIRQKQSAAKAVITRGWALKKSTPLFRKIGNLIGNLIGSHILGNLIGSLSDSILQIWHHNQSQVLICCASFPYAIPPDGLGLLFSCGNMDWSRVWNTHALRTPFWPPFWGSLCDHSNCP